MTARKPKHPDYPRGCILAYLRVSTAEQVDSGAGLDAQRAAILAYAERAGLTVARWFVDEGVSGGVAPAKRPELAEALDVLAGCAGGVLIFAKLDRLIRSMRDLVHLRDLAAVQGWTLSTADGSVDMSTPHGRAAASMAGVFAELERDLIGQRTREALQAKKARGQRLGRPRSLPDAVVARIADQRAAGVSLPKIAAALEADNVPTAQGGARWYPATVAAVLRSVALDEDAARASSAVA